jgi:hypothetical protein
MKANTVASGLAGDFYTTPGLNMLALPLNFANQAAGAENQYNQAVYQTNLANQQAKAQMWSSIGSSMMGAGMNMAGGGFNFGGAGGGAGMQTAQSPWGNVRYSYI